MGADGQRITNMWRLLVQIQREVKFETDKLFAIASYMATPLSGSIVHIVTAILHGEAEKNNSLTY